MKLQGSLGDKMYSDPVVSHPVENNPQILSPADLWSSVLLQAFEDAQISKGDVAENAYFWFVSDERTVGSFLWLCSECNYDPSTVLIKLSKQIILQIRGDFRAKCNRRMRAMAGIYTRRAVELSQSPLPC
jgi:hypothetical protein